MRRSSAIPAVLLVLAGLPGARALAENDAATQAGVFFREPDKETGSRIADLIKSMTSGSVPARTQARRDLETIGYWAVSPLIDALQTMEPPIRCSSALVLDAIHDRRAIEPLRAVMVKEATRPYVSGFAALALGRFRDAGALDSFRAVLKAPKSIEMVRAAIPAALAKLRTNEAREFLVERLRVPSSEAVRNSEMLALGFFPEAALDANGTRPSAELAAGLANRTRRGERQSALLAFLVASRHRAGVKPFLLDVFSSDSAPEVQKTALIGLSHSDDAEITELLAKTAARQGDDTVRELAADLLFDRADLSVKASLMATARNASSARLRAACVLALGRIDDDETTKFVAEKLDDRAPIVHAAAAVALTRRTALAVRVAALAYVEAKLRRGEEDKDARSNIEKARTVLSGERTDVRWNEVGAETLFADMGLDYVQRLLREVNLRLQASLDLTKIHNLQTDAEIVPTGPPTLGDSNEGGGPKSDNGSGGGSDAGTGGTGGGSGGGTGAGAGETPQPIPSPGDGDPPVVGAPRTSQYQELRDLMIELRRSPYFSASDLPQPPVTPSGK